MEKSLALMLYLPLTHQLATNKQIREREVYVKDGHTVMLTKNDKGIVSHNFVTFE
jgi:hypothetical protein